MYFQDKTGNMSVCLTLVAHQADRGGGIGTCSCSCPRLMGHLACMQT